MTDIMERIQQAVAQALEADAEAQEAEEATRQQAASDARAKARQQARQAVWDAGRRRRQKPAPTDEGGALPLSVVTAVLDGKTYSTATATAIAANTADALASIAGDWTAPIEHVLYRTIKGAYFERFYQRLTPLTQEKALSLYGTLKHQLPFADAFPGVELEDA